LELNCVAEGKRVNVKGSFHADLTAIKRKNQLSEEDKGTRKKL